MYENSRDPTSTSNTIHIQQYNMMNFASVQHPNIGLRKPSKRKTKSSTTHERDLLLKLDEYIHVNEVKAASILEKNEHI